MSIRARMTLMRKPPNARIHVYYIFQNITKPSRCLFFEPAYFSMKIFNWPLPMKMRALPQSFWQQPNSLAEVSPTSYCPPIEEDSEQSTHSEVVGVANTELLFSLFHTVEDIEVKEVKWKQPPVARRGRPRKTKNTSRGKLKKDEDPYFTSATVPCIQIEEDEKIAQGKQVLLSVTGEDKNLTSNNSYSERLSNLVVNL